MAFRPDGRLILIRQETKGGVEAPFSEADRRDHPRVCRAYEPPEQGDPKRIAEISDFNRYVYDNATTPNGAYFAVQGTSTATGERARLFQLYDGLTGKRVGSIPTTIPPGNSKNCMTFDPKGTRLCVQRDDRDTDRCDIFEIPSLKVVGMAREVYAVNAGASRWASYVPQSPNRPAEMLDLREQGRHAPLLRFVPDVRRSGEFKFSQDGNHIVWGNQDGTVTVCDLNEVQRRLYFARGKKRLSRLGRF